MCKGLRAHISSWMSFEFFILFSLLPLQILRKNLLNNYFKNYFAFQYKWKLTTANTDFNENYKQWKQITRNYISLNFFSKLYQNFERWIEAFFKNIKRLFVCCVKFYLFWHLDHWKGFCQVRHLQTVLELLPLWWFHHRFCHTCQNDTDWLELGCHSFWESKNIKKIVKYV